MRTATLILRWLAPLALVLPVIAYAGLIDPNTGASVGSNAAATPGVTFTQVIGLFNIFVGLMLTVALLTYFLGFFLWLCRLGTWPTYRTEAIKIMEWSVVIIFVLVVLLAIVQFFQYHPLQASFVLSIIVAVIIIWIILYLAAHSGGGEKKAEEH